MGLPTVTLENSSCPSSQHCNRKKRSKKNEYRCRLSLSGHKSLPCSGKAVMNADVICNTVSLSCLLCNYPELKQLPLLPTNTLPDSCPTGQVANLRDSSSPSSFKHTNKNLGKLVAQSLNRCHKSAAEERAVTLLNRHPNHFWTSHENTESRILLEDVWLVWSWETCIMTLPNRCKEHSPALRTWSLWWVRPCPSEST